ncbi:MAG: LTA synthase family protein [Oligoflexales bacterium]|nr:LTA synthase family protein [Oligoflexales bacterium]
MMNSTVSKFAFIFIPMIGIYTFLRIFFLWANYDLFMDFSWTQFMGAFIDGLKFDLSAVFLISIPSIVLYLVHIFLESKLTETLVKWSFILVHSFFILCNLGDSLYFRFSGKRMNLETFDLSSDIAAQMGQFFVNFFYIPLLWFFLLGFFLFCFPSLRSGPKESYYKKFASVLLILVTTAIFARGGYQGRVLRPLHAYQGEIALAPLKLNSTFTIITSRYSESHSKLMMEREEIESVLTPVPLNHQIVDKSPQNVVILIVESLSSDQWYPVSGRKDILPFLNSLSEDSLIGTKHFANGRTSIAALPSILFGLPLIDRHWARSNYQTNCWRGLGTVLEEKGYQTQFFHGADKESMYFDGISATAGFKEHYHKAHVEDPAFFDGHWGIYDEPFLEFVGDKVSENSKPFISVIFTLSSHQPFSLPKKYQKKFAHIEDEFLRSLRYADHAIENFFEKIKNKPWFDQTLFIITGDHTYADLKEKYMNHGPGKYRVPLIVHHPKHKFQGQVGKVSHHADIYASVIDFLGLKEVAYPLISKSIWSDDPNSYAFFKDDQQYWFISEDSYLSMDPFGQVKQGVLNYDINSPSSLGEEALTVSAEKSKALSSVLAYYYRSLKEDNVYQWIPGRQGQCSFRQSHASVK